jgi:UDP-N-acetylglucosamine 2-epimerase
MRNAHIVLRTERPEAVEAGYAKVMGFDATAICAEIEARAGRGRPSQEHPYGTGDAAKKIVDALEGFLEK